MPVETLEDLFFDGLENTRGCERTMAAGLRRVLRGPGPRFAEFQCECQEGAAWSCERGR